MQMHVHQYLCKGRHILLHFIAVTLHEVGILNKYENFGSESYAKWKATCLQCLH